MEGRRSSGDGVRLRASSGHSARLAMIICGERRTGQSSDMGWSPWGAGCVNGARPVLGGGEAQSIKSMLYAKLESALLTASCGSAVFSKQASPAAAAVMRGVLTLSNRRTSRVLVQGACKTR